jgi:acetolactate synthase-1/2/3 large subunit
VHLSLPTDVLDGAASPQAMTGDMFAVKPMTLSEAMAGVIIEAVSRAKRPLVLVGPACMTKAGRTKTAALEASWGVPVVGMESPRGIADPSLGAFSEVISRADFVLLIGKRVDFTLKFGKAFALSCRFMQVDPEQHELDRAARAIGDRLEATFVADAIATVTGLALQVKRARSEWAGEVRDAIAFRPVEWDSAEAGTGRLHPVQMLRPLQVLLEGHPEAVFVSDGGEIGQWAQACLTAPHRIINGVTGSIGSAIHFALASRLARPDAPVIAVMGDGTFGFHSAEIDTGVRYRLPCVAVVGNDARWNAEYQIQLREYGRERLIGCELLPTRYDEVARAFGGFGEMVTEAAQMLQAAQRAERSGLPAVLNVMIEGLPAPQVARTAR